MASGYYYYHHVEITEQKIFLMKDEIMAHQYDVERRYNSSVTIYINPRWILAPSFGFDIYKRPNPIEYDFFVMYVRVVHIISAFSLLKVNKFREEEFWSFSSTNYIINMYIANFCLSRMYSNINQQTNYDEIIFFSFYDIFVRF